MIDTWPISPSRYDPPLAGNITTPEQHAAEILLYPFGGEALPCDRYSHVSYLNTLSVIHTHNIMQVIEHPDNSFRERFVQMYNNSKN